MRFCDAVAAAGVETEVISMKVRVLHDEPSLHRPLREVYGLHATFPIHLLPSRLTQQSSRRAISAVRLTLYSFWGTYALLAGTGTRRGPSVFYFKNLMLAAPFSVLRSLFRRRVLLAFEMHDAPHTKRERALLRRADVVLSNHPALTRDLGDFFAGTNTKVVTVHQGVDLPSFEAQRVSAAEARAAVGLPGESKLVVYTGKVFVGWKEIELLLSAARDFDPGTLLIVVGGRPDHVARFRTRLADDQITNVIFTGFVAPADVYLYQLAADVLVMYYSYDKPLLRYVSPGKLFEYMAARRPIVSADHASVREILPPHAAVYVTPEAPAELAAAVNELLKDEARQAALAGAAYALVEEYTWSRRAERFIRLVQERLRLEPTGATS